MGYLKGMKKWFHLLGPAAFSVGGSKDVQYLNKE
jgi:hypothetical protein